MSRQRGPVWLVYAWRVLAGRRRRIQLSRQSRPAQTRQPGARAESISPGRKTIISGGDAVTGSTATATTCASSASRATAEAAGRAGPGDAG